VTSRCRGLQRRRVTTQRPTGHRPGCGTCGTSSCRSGQQRASYRSGRLQRRRRDGDRRLSPVDGGVVRLEPGPGAVGRQRGCAVPGDYNGDGVTDVAIYRPATGEWYVRGQFTVQWGASGDIPVPATTTGWRRRPDSVTDINRGVYVRTSSRCSGGCRATSRLPPDVLPDAVSRGAGLATRRSPDGLPNGRCRAARATHARS